VSSLLSFVPLTQSVVYDIPKRWPGLGQPFVGYVKQWTNLLAHWVMTGPDTFAYWQGVVTILAFSAACLSLYGLARSSEVRHAATITGLFASEIVSVHQFSLYFLTNDIQKLVADVLPSVSNMDVLYSSTSIFIAMLLILAEEVWLDKKTKTLPKLSLSRENLPPQRPRREGEVAQALRSAKAGERLRGDQGACGWEGEAEEGDAGDGVCVRDHEHAVPGDAGEGRRGRLA